MFCPEANNCQFFVTKCHFRSASFECSEEKRPTRTNYFGWWVLQDESKTQHDAMGDNVVCVITFTICFDRCLKRKSKVSYHTHKLNVKISLRILDVSLMISLKSLRRLFRMFLTSSFWTRRFWERTENNTFRLNLTKRYNIGLFNN